MLARLTAALCAVVLLVGAVTASYRQGVVAGWQAAPSGHAGQAAPPPQVRDPGQLERVEEVLRRLDAEAVRAPDSDALVEGAVRGLVEALDDPYAEYYDGEEFTAFNRSLDGEFSGVGLLLNDTRGHRKGLLIADVIDGTPAARAGILKGERIVSVDGADVRDKPTDAVVNLVKGRAGTQVTLGLTGGPQGRREVTLTREVFEVPNLESERLSDGSGYVKLQQFTQGSGSDVRRAVDRLVAEGAPGLVLDLRGNPGGLLGEAVDVASVFMEDGPVVSVQERNAEPRVYSATGDALEALPLVVLVDQYSASASEIVAGALQERGRGTVVGVPTFGKGTVQTIKPLESGGGVKFTTAEYFLPDGDSIEGVGVHPDEVVKVTRDELARGDDRQLDAARRALQALVARAGG